MSLLSFKLDMLRLQSHLCDLERETFGRCRVQIKQQLLLALATLHTSWVRSVVVTLYHDLRLIIPSSLATVVQYALISMCMCRLAQMQMHNF